MNGETLRIGIVGANAARGWAKDAHLPAIAASPDFRIVSIAARSQDIADDAGSAFGAARTYTDALALVRAPEVDVITVAVKVPEHRAIVLAALQAGKHVYCEWPLGRDFAETREMAEAAARARSCAMLGLQGLSSRALRRAHAMVREGALGKLLRMSVSSPTAGWGPSTPAFYEYLQDRSTGATLATITGGHTLAAMEALAGGFIEVDARTDTFHKSVRIAGTDRMVGRDCADNMMVLSRHESGCVSLLEVIGGAQGKLFRLELVGTLGSLMITGDFPGGYQAGELTFNATVPFAPLEAPFSPELVGPPVNVSEAYARFAEAIRAGGSIEPNFATGMRLTNLIDAIECASKEGRRQKVAAPS